MAANRRSSKTLIAESARGLNGRRARDGVPKSTGFTAFLVGVGVGAAPAAPPPSCSGEVVIDH